MIALSIMLPACEIVRLRHGQISLTSRWPWIVAFSFGLLHGFGFASALTDIVLPQGDSEFCITRYSRMQQKVEWSAVQVARVIERGQA